MALVLTAVLALRIVEDAMPRRKTAPRKADPAAEALLKTRNPHAASVAIGASELWVCVPPGSVPTGSTPPGTAPPELWRGQVPDDAAQALRWAARNLQRSQSALGAFFRRIAARRGVAKAITATAYKLARIVYALLKHGAAYVAQGMREYEQAYRERLLKNLSRKARELGCELTPPSRYSRPERGARTEGRVATWTIRPRGVLFCLQSTTKGREAV